MEHEQGSVEARTDVDAGYGAENPRSYLLEHFSAPCVRKGFWWIGSLFLAYFALFRLPYWFPPRHVVSSISVNMGFNNSVAVLVVLVIVALLVIVRSPSSSAYRGILSVLPFETASVGEISHKGMGKRLLFVVMTLYLGAALLLFWTVPILEEYGEAGYFLHRIGLIVQYDLAPYRDIEFGYGPALVYLSIWFTKLGQHLGLSLPACYLVCYSFLCTIGVWLLFFVVDNLHIPHHRKAQLFCTLGLACIGISMGLQYLLVRFLFPLFLFIALHRSLPQLLKKKSWSRCCMAWSLCTLAGLGALLVSPEMGLVYLICQSSGYAFRIAKGSMAYFPCLIATLFALPVCIVFFSPGYFATVFTFAKGGANFPLVPSIFVVFFLGTLFYIIPIAFKELRKYPDDSRSSLLFVLALHPLLTLPAALGRSDAGHIMLNGISAFILTFSLLALRSPRALRAFMITMLLVFGGASQVTSFWLYAGYLTPVFATLMGRSLPPETRSSLVDQLGLEQCSRIATPLGMDRLAENQLRDKGLYLPQYNPDTFNIGTPDHVARQIQDLKKANFLLIPVEFLQFRSSEEIDSLWMNPSFRRQLEEPQQTLMRRVLLYPVDYRITRKPYLPDLELAKYILSHYRPIRVGVGYALMVAKEGV